MIPPVTRTPGKSPGSSRTPASRYSPIPVFPHTPPAMKLFRFPPAPAPHLPRRAKKERTAVLFAGKELEARCDPESHRDVAVPTRDAKGGLGEHADRPVRGFVLRMFSERNVADDAGGEVDRQIALYCGGERRPVGDAQAAVGTAGDCPTHADVELGRWNGAEDHATRIREKEKKEKLFQRTKALQPSCSRCSLPKSRRA